VAPALAAFSTTATTGASLHMKTNGNHVIHCNGKKAPVIAIGVCSGAAVS
jgi:hypothetical protein